MTDKELQKLGRRELLQLLLNQAQESDRLAQELAEITRQLRQKEEAYEKLRERLDKKDVQIHQLRDTLQAEREKREVDMNEVGSIAEAALRLNGVFDAAQRAADLYLKHIQERYPAEDGDLLMEAAMSAGHALEEDYPPEPAYPSEPAYEPAYRPEPFYPAKPVYRPEPAYRPEAFYPAEPAYRPAPAYRPEPIYRPEPARKTEPVYQAKQTYREEPVYQEQPAYQPEPVHYWSRPKFRAEPAYYRTEPVYRTEPAYRREPTTDAGATSDEDAAPKEALPQNPGGSKDSHLAESSMKKTPFRTKKRKNNRKFTLSFGWEHD